MTKIYQLSIEGMTCAACAARIEKVINRIDDVHIQVNLANHRANVEIPDSMSVETVIERVNKTGFTASLYQQNVTPASSTLNYQRDFFIALLFAIPLLAEMIVMFIPSLGHELIPRFWQWALATPVQFWLGARFYKGAWHSLKSGAANMDVLVALGTSIAYLYSVIVTLGNFDALHVYFEASTVIITFVLMGKWLEARAKHRVSENIQALIELQPQEARVERDHQILTLNIQDIMIGDIVITPEGETIPVDGIILNNDAWVDESMLSGEPLPVQKQINDHVYAATKVVTGQVRCQTTQLSHNTQLAHIITAIENAQNSKPAIQNQVDKIANIFVPSILIISALTFVLSWLLGVPLEQSLIRAVAVLVIACPCALGLATPAAIMVGLSQAAKHGILYRDAQALENAQHIDLMVVDKTGTLTLGKPSLNQIIRFNETPEQDILQIAASLESGTKHPLAHAILEAAKTLPLLPVDELSTHVGQGISGVINQKTYSLNSLSSQAQHLTQAQTELVSHNITDTVILLLEETQIIAAFLLNDPLRDTSPAVIQHLLSEGIDIALLSGDHLPTVQHIAKQCHITHFYANSKPQDKAQFIAEQQRKGLHVAMVGDGVNDAPAMAQADISFAMAQGNHIALETAQVTLMHNDLKTIIDAIDLSKACLRKIHQNLFFAFIYNIIGIPLAALGLLNPMLAGLAMALSSVSVISNALLLKRWQGRSIS